MSEVTITGKKMVLHGYTGQLLEELNGGRATENDIKRWEEKYHRFQEMLEGRILVVALGSAGDHVVSPNLGKFSSLLFRGYVDNKIASGTGHADTGYMYVVAKSVITAWDQNEKRAFSAPLFGVPLLFQGTSTEQKFRPSEHFPEISWLQDTDKRKKAVICSPGHLTLGTRTPCLIGHDKLAAQLYYPGGWGTTEEFATSGVGHQLKDGIASCHNGAVYPPLRILIDDGLQENGTHRWFYQPLAEYLFNMMKMETINQDSISDILVVRINGEDKREQLGPIRIQYFKTPNAAADFVLNRTLENIQT